MARRGAAEPWNGTLARGILIDLYREAVAAVDPGLVLPRHARIEQGAWVFERAGRRLALPLPDRASGARLRVIGIGKAAGVMAEGLLSSLSPQQCIDEALIVGLDAPPRGSLPDHWRVLDGDHPLPGERSLAAGRAVARFADEARPGDRHLVLLTGGASALCAAPPPGVTLADKVAATRLLMHAGAPIAELNALRKHLSMLKGGQLAACLEARGASVATLALSDVEGDDGAVIGSGPTVPDRSTYAEARAALERHGVWDRTPAAVRAHLEAGIAGARPETPKPGRGEAAFATVATLDDALAASAAAGGRRGLNTLSLGRTLHGDVAEHARQLAAALRGLRGTAPALLVAGGEPVLRVQGDGLGGRMQELALRVALEIAGETDITLLAAGTDGIDGPTVAAGAFADGGTLARMAAAGIDARAALSRSDSHRAMAAAGDLFVPGATRTNVADVVVALVGGR